MTHRSSNDILDDAPIDLAELADWFRSLNDKDLEAVWVSAVTSLLAEETSVVTVRPIADALTVVRERLHRGKGNPRPFLTGRMPQRT